MAMTKARARSEMLHELERLQEQLRDRWLHECLPEDWDGLDTWAPQPRHRTRVTLRLDTDMVRWFRNTGPGYGARMNSVLRIYWTALLAGHIGAYLGEDTTPRLRSQALELQRSLQAARQEAKGTSRS